MPAKPLAAKLTISRVTCSHRDGYISITLIDQASGCEIVEAEVSFEQFTLALTGMGRVPTQVMLGDWTVIGKRLEVKHETVFVPDGDYKERRARSLVAVAPFEVDGWEGRPEDCENAHKIVRPGNVSTTEVGRFYTVTFIRFVDPPEPETT